MKTTCVCTAQKRCEPCAERDFALLMQKCKNDPSYQREEALRATIIIQPDPAARESIGGYHRMGLRGRKVARECSTDDAAPTDAEMRHASDRLRRACDEWTLRERAGIPSWLCPSCGPVMPREDEDGWRCRRCDAVCVRGELPASKASKPLRPEKQKQHDDENQAIKNDGMTDAEVEAWLDAPDESC